MNAAQRELFRELLTPAATPGDAEAAFYAGLCRLETLSLEGFARLSETLSALAAPMGLRRAVAQVSDDRVRHARLAGMLARRSGLGASPPLAPPAGEAGAGPALAREPRGAAFVDLCDDEDLSQPHLRHLGGESPVGLGGPQVRQHLLALAQRCAAEGRARQGCGELLRASAGGWAPLRSAALRTLAEDEARASRVLEAVAAWARKAAAALPQRAASPATMQA